MDCIKHGPGDMETTTDQIRKRAPMLRPRRLAEQIATTMHLYEDHHHQPQQQQQQQKEEVDTSASVTAAPDDCDFANILNDLANGRFASSAIYEY
jgi:hypothetical protein